MFIYSVRDLGLTLKRECEDMRKCDFWSIKIIIINNNNNAKR